MPKSKLNINWQTILIMVLGVVITLTVQNIFLKPEVPNYDYLEKRVQEHDRVIQQQQRIIMKSETNVIERDERITKDSLFIHNSDRKSRDSLRQLLNPPR